MNAFWASENFEAFIIFRSSQPRGPLDSHQECSSFPASGQIEALDRRMDQLFGHHAPLSKWLRSTTACARQAFDSQLARAKWMTSQFMAICSEGAPAPGQVEQHLKKK